MDGPGVAGWKEVAPMQAERGSSFRGEKRLALVEWGFNAWLDPDVVRKVSPKAVSRFSAHSSRLGLTLLAGGCQSENCMCLLDAID